MISKSDRSVTNEMPFLRLLPNLNSKGMHYLIFPVLSSVCVLHEIISTHNSKEWKSTSRSARSYRNAYFEQQD